MYRGRRNAIRTLLIVASGLTLGLSAGCSSGGQGSDSPGAASSVAASSSAAAALSSAAQASPGGYGSPADPSLPNPSGVATDNPAATATATSSPVIVTYAGWVDASSSVEVGAYLPGIIESGGTCTLTLTGSGTPATVSVSAEPDAGSTSCPTLAVVGSVLASGQYSAVVSYSSDGTTGTSAATSVDVP